MFPDEQSLSTDRWIRPRLRNGIGGRRRLDGSGGHTDTTPVREWKLRAAGDSAGGNAGVSARKLAAELWRLCSTVNDIGGRYALFGGRDFEPSPPLPNTKFETEGITKWEICYSKTFDVSLKRSKEIAAIFSTRQTANEFEAGRRLRKKINYSINKFNEERASSIKTEHPEAIFSTVNNLAGDIKREREKCRRLNIANSKLLSDIAKTKSSTRTLVQSLEREKNSRKLLECVCNELAKVVEGSRLEITKLRSQCAQFQEEVEDERKMMQIAEVWREEGAQMKLVDAKLMLEGKCTKMNRLIADAEEFLRPNSTNKKVTWKEKSRVATQQTSLDGRAVDQQSNPHVVRAMKGHIMWPRGIQRHSLAAKHLEAKLESRRMLMRNVLKQRC